ncbi:MULTISPECIES: phosphotransferase family protein [Streptomyces]|uniref:Phosphotransferase family protein n=1 Tax=Streptomyces mutomycini TaxID=284036 RepID=A0ABW0B8E6_9ACTN|nr:MULTISPECIES: aminoglycoside phosphotransferase family protein [Streptomyces]
MTGALPDGSGVSRRRIRSWLASLGVDHGRIIDAQEFVARSRAVMLRFEDGTSLFLKEMDNAAGVAIDAAFRNEEAMLRLVPVAGLPVVSERAIPRLVATDPESGTLVMEGKVGFASLRELVQSSPDIPVSVLVAMASVVAGIHRTPVPDTHGRDASGLRSFGFPFASFAVLTPEQLVGGPGMDYPAYVAAMQAVDTEVDMLRRSWQPSSLVHFDLRDDNILVRENADDRPEVALVDWEMAGYGDPLLDVGTVVGQLLVQWLQTVRDTPEQLASAAAWTTVRRNAGLFITAYEHVAPLSEEQHIAVFRYAGLFALMHAAGRLEQIGSLGRIGHLCLFVGRQLLKNPQGIAELFLPSKGRSSRA